MSADPPLLLLNSTLLSLDRRHCRVSIMASDGNTTKTPRNIITYHCICTHLLLASTQPLATLPTRSSLDKSSILRLPPASHAEELSEYAVLLGTTLDRAPVIIRGDQGFEKRYLQKCGRCNLTVGYQLDKAQYEGMDEKGRRDDVVYLLPGGLLTTEEMSSGKDVGPSLAIDG
ncbi:uncharacterized protein PV09_05578 [Verruconis gallopava]|uniref:STEEP1 domain-containing protein n=1 Tax=Verruconis gallopava TaxID=253628 RepID=A0A0D2A9T6_9PEZI|nr:uncharacterized protein PV09_05578 [Verruconis gallopava]KIW03370.1 hypothetical protein PV09_05578 [Verruconis gallopava]